DERLVLFASITAAGSAEASIFRFVSADGIEFIADPPGPVLSPAASGALRFDAPSVVRTDEGLRIFYEVDDGTAIETALDTSGAGTSFGAATVALAPASAWEGTRVGSPGAVLVDGQVVLAYEGGDGEGIGLTVFTGGATTNAGSPALVPVDLEDPERFSDVSEVRDPFLYVAESESGRRILRLYVAAMGIARPANTGGTFDQPNYSIAAAGDVLDGPIDTLVLEAHSAN